jgi:hypothetical protein
MDTKLTDEAVGVGTEFHNEVEEDADGGRDAGLQGVISYGNDGT